MQASFPSLRSDLLRYEELGLIKKLGERTLTIAPEVASENLALAIGKCISPSVTESVAEEAYKAGFKQMKMYFMYGIPGEREEDVASIGNLVNRILRIGYNGIRLSITPWIPKPHTPLQWEGQEDLKELMRKRKIILKSLRGGRVRVTFFNPKKARIEAVLARGDENISRAILYVAIRNNYTVGAWHKAFQEANVDIKEYANRSIPLDEKLPWDFIDIGISKEFLVREWENFHKGKAPLHCRLRLFS